MLPKELRSLLFTVVQQIINGQSEYKYGYKEFHEQSDLKRFRFTASVDDKVGEICLTFPVDIAVSDVKVLEGRVDAIVAAEGAAKAAEGAVKAVEVAVKAVEVAAKAAEGAVKAVEGAAKWTAEWIIPVRWSCPVDSQAVLGSHMSSVGVLYLAWDQEKKCQQAIWLGATTPEILEAVKTLVEARGIALVRNSYQLRDNAPSTKRLPEAQAGFLADLETQVARVETERAADVQVVREHFSEVFGVYLAGKHRGGLSGHVNPSELPIQSVMRVLSTYAPSFLSAELNFEDDRIILGFTEDEMAYIKSKARSCTLGSNLRNLFEQPEENFTKLVPAVCQDAFFAVCHILMANKEFVRQYRKKFDALKSFEEHLPVFNELVSKIVYKLFYVFLNDLHIPDSLTREKQEAIKNNLSNIVIKLNEISNKISLIKLRFQNVYKQLLRCIYESQENTEALQNIENFLCLFFQKELPSDFSFEGLLGFLDNCFFEWNDCLEELIPTSGSTVSLDAAVPNFIRQIRTLESRSYPAVIFASEFLGGLSIELRGSNKTLEELAESVGNTPLRDKAQAWREEYRDGKLKPADLDMNDLSITLDLNAGSTENDLNSSFAIIQQDTNLDVSEIRTDGECPADVFSKPVFLLAPAQEFRLPTEAAAVSKQDAAEPLVPGTAPAAGAEARPAAEAVLEWSATDVAPAPMTTKVAVDSKSYTVAATEGPVVSNNAPASDVAKPSVPWYRFALGVVGLGLLGLGIAAVIIASHGAGAGAVAAAMPWLANGVVYPLMAYAGMGASVAVTSVAVAAGVSLSVAAVPPAPRHRLLDRVKACFGHRGEESKSTAPALIGGGSSAQVLNMGGARNNAPASVPGGAPCYGSVHAAVPDKSWVATPGSQSPASHTLVMW